MPLNRCFLLGAKDTVARVAQARDDVAVFIQALVDGGDKDVNIRMGFLHGFNADRRGQQAHKLDVLHAAVLEGLHGRYCRAACRHHGVDEDDVTLGNIARQLAIIFDRLEGFRVALQAQMANLGRGDEFQHTVHHAQACT